MQISEKYPLDGSVAKWKRRDLRRGVLSHCLPVCWISGVTAKHGRQTTGLRSWQTVGAIRACTLSHKILHAA